MYKSLLDAKEETRGEFCKSFGQGPTSAAGAGASTGFSSFLAAAFRAMGVVGVCSTGTTRSEGGWRWDGAETTERGEEGTLN
jgi:hypothetical protein